jgi:anaerobic dimethyl sulfoxide reductase subunit B (iron-sulfur subunit)
MKRKGLLIDYEYCCGCHTCEVACAKEHDYMPGQWGIHVHEEGPWRIEGSKRAQYDIIPFPTELCDLCETRTARGKLPTCVAHCQTNCMVFGDVSNLAKELNKKSKLVLFVPK